MAGNGRVRFHDEHNVGRSLSRRGNAIDVAAMKSFCASLTKEHIRRQTYRTTAGARGDIFDDIEVFYSREHPRERLGGMSPAEFEEKMLIA